MLLLKFVSFWLPIEVMFFFSLTKGRQTSPEKRVVRITDEKCHGFILSKDHGSNDLNKLMFKSFEHVYILLRSPMYLSIPNENETKQKNVFH